MFIKQQYNYKNKFQLAKLVTFIKLNRYNYIDNKIEIEEVSRNVHIYRTNMYCIITVPSQFWRELRHDTPEEEHARGEIFYSRGTH